MATGTRSTQPFTLGLLLVFLSLWSADDAEAKLKIGFMGGSSASIPTNLTIYQENQPKISMTAHYDTRPLTPAFYYAYRMGWWEAKSGWELELIHQKIYLNNPTPEVLEFKVTFGYNLLLVNRAWTVGWFDLRAGAGVVIVHTASNIRGQAFSLPDAGPFDGTYRLAGIGTQISISYPHYFTSRFFMHVETKFTAAYALVPVAQGVAHTPNVAFHGLVGMGVDLW